MENRSHALIAGLFTLLLGVAAIAALWWFGGKSEEMKHYVVATTKSVTGLNAQAQVRYRGVRVGRVEQIELDAADIRNTLIRIGIRADIPVTEGTVAKLGFQGVTGIAHIQLDDDGSKPALRTAGADGVPRIPMRDSFVQELSETGADALRNVRELVAGINQVLTPENRQSMVRALANLEATTGNARAVSAQLRQLLSPENTRQVQALLRRSEEAAGEAAPLFAEARTLVARWQTVGDKLDQVLGDSATGPAAALVPRVNELAGELSSTSRQLTRVLQMVEESPQSLLFGGGRLAPGPGEAGFVAPEAHKETP